MRPPASPSVRSSACRLLPGRAQVPEAVAPRHLSVSQDITAEEHVRMQAAIQAFVDNSISKTAIVPESATIEDVRKPTFSRGNSAARGSPSRPPAARQEVVLETKATARARVTTPARRPRHRPPLHRGRRHSGIRVAHGEAPRPRRVCPASPTQGNPAGRPTSRVTSTAETQPFECS